MIFCLISLGIIFFEMCYRPLTTLMERDKIIGSIRRPEMVFPDDFQGEKYSKQVSRIHMSFIQLSYMTIFKYKVTIL